MKYDIFISYRRDGGDKYARTIQQALEKRYRVFLDFDELEDGVFDQRIIDAINNSPVFLLILSKGALDRCVNEDDWVRQEILQAIKSGCHIVPVTIVEDNFEGIPSDLPKELQHAVGQHQFSELQMKTLFKESMEKMVKSRIAPYVHRKNFMSVIAIKPLWAWIQTPLSRFCHMPAFVRYILLGSLFVALMVSAVLYIRFRVVEVSPMGNMTLVRNYEGKYGLKDRTGNVVSPCQWNEIKQLSQCLMVVQDTTRYLGIIDTTGTIISPCQWKNVLDFTDGMARVEDAKGYWGYIDSTGVLAIPCRWKVAQRFHDGRALVSNGEGLSWVIDKTGELAVE